jgi:tetratricopeptide (TPR) repeat protein
VSALKLAGLALCVTGLGYALVSPAGALAPRLADLPEPAKAEGLLGAPVARLERAPWLAACRAADIPDIELPAEVEHEPMRRMVVESRAWTQGRDADALGRMGEIALALDLGEPAVDLFTAAASSGKERARWLYLLGSALQQQGRLALAVTALREAQSLDPKLGIARARIGRALFELGESDAARVEFDACLLADPTRALGHIGLARLALARSDAKTALSSLDAAGALTPGDYVIWTLRAQALAALGRADESRRDSERAARLPRYRGWLSFDPLVQQCNERARTFAHVEASFGAAQSRGDVARMATLADELTARVPLDAEAWRRAAASQVAARNMPAARERIERAVELAPRSVSVLCTASEIAMASEDRVRALELARRAVAADPASAFAHEVLGRASYLNGDFLAALTHARRAVELAPADHDKRQVLVEILLGLQRLDEAELELETFLAVAPEHPWAKAQLDGLRKRR